MGSSYKLDQCIPVQMPFFKKKKTFLWWWCLFLQVLEEVGQFVLSSCFSGYNSCLFSYGACGSGKTHIMFGTDKSQGLMSWICENLFKRASCYDDDTSFRAEIRYNFSFTVIRGWLYVHGLEKNLLNFLLWESPYISGYLLSPFISKRGFLLRNVCIYQYNLISWFFCWLITFPLPLLLDWALYCDHKQPSWLQMCQRDRHTDI